MNDVARARRAVLPVMSVCVAHAACAKKSDAPAGDTASVAAPPPLPALDTNARYVSGAALSDANIVAMLDAENVADSAAGALAAEKGTNPDVKMYGRLMMVEHHALRVQAEALAKRRNLEPRLPAGDQSREQLRQTLEMLGRTPKGAEFDKAYVDHEVTFHEAVLETAQKALAATRDPDLKDLISKAVPNLEAHFDKAKALQVKLR